MERYGVIAEKRPREIVLLRGRGCAYRRCTFCDYHLDADPNDTANFELNRAVLAQVSGRFGDLEVINSGSVFELDGRTLDLVESTARERGITTLHFEAHWLYRDRIPQLRERFATSGVELKMKLGLETFDYELRERVLRKGIPERDPHAIAEPFDEANLLVGLTGQTADSMRRDIELALRLFERVCVSVMCANSTPVQPDQAAVDAFKAEVYPRFADDPRADILLNNTDFGVGD